MHTTAAAKPRWLSTETGQKLNTAMCVISALTSAAAAIALGIFATLRTGTYGSKAMAAYAQGTKELPPYRLRISLFTSDPCGDSTDLAQCYTEVDEYNSKGMKYSGAMIAASFAIFIMTIAICYKTRKKPNQTPPTGTIEMPQTGGTQPQGSNEPTNRV